MCLLYGTNCVFISKKTSLFIVTAVNTANPTIQQLTSVHAAKASSPFIRREVCVHSDVLMISVRPSLGERYVYTQTYL
jgi:hypothetical protein